MTIVFEERPSDSPLIDTVMRGQTLRDGTATRPAEIGWHMVVTRYHGKPHPLVVGPWAESGTASWGEGAEILWIRFKTGAFMPHLPTRSLLDTELALPDASCNSFWLHSSTWELPTYENVETFINRLVREEILVRDPVVTAALEGHPHDLASRTVRDRFLRATGLTHNHIRQVERARRAVTLLEAGVSILDTVYEAGYFDQPHLTRSLRRFIGYTPAQIIQMHTCTPLSAVETIAIETFRVSYPELAELAVP